MKGNLLLQSRKALTRRSLLQAAATVTAGIVVTPEPALTAPDNHSLPLYLAQAKTVVDVLQTKWFHSAPYSQWGNDQNAWNTYNTIEALIDYTQITRNRRYIPVIRQAATDKVLLKKIMGDGVDDEGWAGIALVKAYRLLREPACIEAAQTIFASMTTYWDDTCKGGVWWNFKRTYKNAITNELFLLLAALLYQETHDESYLNWAKKEWDWFLQSGMINEENLVNDGLHQCKNNRDTTWTYNQGVILAGLTVMYQITRERTYLNHAGRIAAAAMSRLAQPIHGVPVLQEPGKDLNADQQQFKGVFVRCLAKLSLFLPGEGTPGKKTIRQFVSANADNLWKIARNDANEINAYWHVCERASIYNAITQTAGLDLLNAAVLTNR